MNCTCSPGPSGNFQELDDTDLNSPNAITVNEVSNDHPTESASSLSSAPEAEAAEQIGREEKHVLVDIRNLLQSVVQSMTRQRRQKETDQRLMNDWLLAAAVIDRLFFILVLLFFIGGSLAFILLFLVVRAANS